MENQVSLFAGTKSKELATKVALGLGRPIGRHRYHQYKDGEVGVTLEEEVDQKWVLIFQSTYPPLEGWMELFLMCNAAKNAGAREVIVVMPYMGYMRQDELVEGSAWGAQLVGKLLVSSGVDSIITCDLHAQVDSFFDCPVHNIDHLDIFLAPIRQSNNQNRVLVAPDESRGSVVKRYAEVLNVPAITGMKIRYGPNEVGHLELTGPVTGKEAVIIDDMVDTGGTIREAATQLKKAGAAKVHIFCTHALLSPGGTQCLQESPIDSMTFSDTIPLRISNFKPEIVSCSENLVKVIKKIIKEGL